MFGAGRKAGKNATRYGHEIWRERCSYSHLEVHKISRRYHQPFLNGEENAGGTEATAGRRLGDLPRGVAVERELPFG